jgi:hypothetical protein
VLRRKLEVREEVNNERALGAVCEGRLASKRDDAIYGELILTQTEAWTSPARMRPSWRSQPQGGYGPNTLPKVRSSS